MTVNPANITGAAQQSAKASSAMVQVEIVFMLLYWLITVVVLIYVNMVTLRINSSNRFAKKMIYLLIFIVNFVLGKMAFKHINPVISTGLPLLSIYLFNRILGDVVILGVTGGIACGKSTLVKGLKENLQLTLIDCDEISRTISLPGHKGYEFILKLLGDRKGEYLEGATGLIKRDKLSERAFNDSEFRKKLTSGLGKFIFWELVKQLLKAAFTGQKYILVDAPLLFETKVLSYLCYPIIVVYIDQEEQIKRLGQRNGYNREEAISRIASQMPIAEKVRRGNICINNNKSKAELVQNCQKALEKFLAHLRRTDL